jgi:hypothetical protein
VPPGNWKLKSASGTATSTRTVAGCPSMIVVDWPNVIVVVAPLANDEYEIVLAAVAIAANAARRRWKSSAAKQRTGPRAIFLPERLRDFSRVLAGH